MNSQSEFYSNSTVVKSVMSIKALDFKESAFEVYV